MPAATPLKTASSRTSHELRRKALLARFHLLLRDRGLTFKTLAERLGIPDERLRHVAGGLQASPRIRRQIEITLSTPVWRTVDEHISLERFHLAVGVDPFLVSLPTLRKKVTEAGFKLGAWHLDVRSRIIKAVDGELRARLERAAREEQATPRDRDMERLIEQEIEDLITQSKARKERRNPHLLQGLRHRAPALSQNQTHHP